MNGLGIPGRRLYSLPSHSTFTATCPSSPEGELTQLRARTVSRANLGKYGFILGLDKYIALGKGEERAGGRGKKLHHRQHV